MKRGKTIYFRSVEEFDADFILSLRTDEKLNNHLSKTSSSISAQRQWITEYKAREKENKEYYFIICRCSDSLAIGTVRLYDFIDEKKSFCWGSWILNSNKTRTSAIESALLVYEFSFHDKKFTRCHFDVRKANISVNKFHHKFGAHVLRETELDYFYEYSKREYIEFYSKNKHYIEK
jgi:RimJ/RimL family protein N-acetyltransferase